MTYHERARDSSPAPDAFPGEVVLVHTGAGSIRVEARAKVNLFLAVGARRADGYHDVTTVMQAIGLADVVTVSRGGSGIRLTTEPSLGIPQEDDLAYRAARAWAGVSGDERGASIHVSKTIPAGAGLGGGSADAAAVLAALSAWRPGDELQPLLAQTAAGLGADVPFFLGSGTQVMGGRGDRVIEVLPTPVLEIVLVNPGVPVPTGAAYAQFDRTVRDGARSADAMVAAVRSGHARAIAEALYDNMTEASCALVPEIRVALRFLQDAPGVLGVAMAGSGSTVFAVCEDADAAARCAELARQRGWWSEAVSTVSEGLSVAVAGYDGTMT